MPVSTTHTVVGATIGAGIAVGGRNAVKWGWDGVSQILGLYHVKKKSGLMRVARGS